MYCICIIGASWVGNRGYISPPPLSVIKLEREAKADPLVDRAAMNYDIETAAAGRCFESTTSASRGLLKEPNYT